MHCRPAYTRGYCKHLAGKVGGQLDMDKDQASCFERALMAVAACCQLNALCATHELSTLNGAIVSLHQLR